MSSEYDPTNFQVRVSPELFVSLANRLTGSDQIDPANAREEALVQAARTDEAGKLVHVLEQQAQTAALREQTAHNHLERASASLEKKLSTARVRLTSNAGELPCAKARSEAAACFRRGDGLACTREVERFAACARRVAELEEA